MKLPNLINGTVLLLLEISSEKKIAHDHIIKKWQNTDQSLYSFLTRVYALFGTKI